MKSHWKGSEIYCFSRSTTQNFLRQPTMVANIFEDFEASSKKSLVTPLYLLESKCSQWKQLIDALKTPWKQSIREQNTNLNGLSLYDHHFIKKQFWYWGKLNSKGLCDVVLCAIWYHWYNLQNVKNTHGGVLIS